MLGEEVIVAKGNKPVVKIVRIKPIKREPGTGKGIWISPEFNRSTISGSTCKGGCLTELGDAALVQAKRQAKPPAPPSVINWLVARWGIHDR